MVQIARCGCSGSVACSCILQEGDNVTITGSGTVGSPFVISANDNLFTVNDTPTIDLTLVAGSPDILTGAVKLDPAAGNLITATANGIRLDCATISSVCGIVAITVLDSTSIDFTIAGGQISGGVIIDPVAGNLLTNTGTGLKVVCSGVRGCFSAGNGITYSSGTGAISAKLSTDLNNKVVFGTDNGLFVAAGNALGQAVQQVYTSSTTWTNPGIGLKGIWVELQGGGGGSGGCATTAANFTAGSGGGKGGAYARFWLDASLLGASHAVTVGTGGTAAAAGANSGGNGVASSFAAFGSVPGGEGGSGGGSADPAVGNSTSQPGGSAAQAFTGTATGVLFIQGDDGGTGVRIALSAGVIPGYGGRSHLGRQQKIGTITTGQMAAVAGSLYGGGAAGPANMTVAGATQQAGAAGAAGIVVVTEIY